MQIVDFTAAHVEQAAQIALQNYKKERGFVPALPPVEKIPDLAPFAENGLGVAAFDGDTMLGFLCGVSPFQNAFGSTGATGVFSPMGAKGAVGENRAKVYARLYQAAGEKWAKAGAASHALCLYAHDREAREQFFRYGFGLRCVDAIKLINSAKNNSPRNDEFFELPRKDAGCVTGLRNALIKHLAQSPCFMKYPSMTEEEAINRVNQRDSRIFVVKDNDHVIAFLEVMTRGENFACDAPDMMNICGAYLLSEYRGQGLFDALLAYAESILSHEGYRRLGVDFESINPTAYGFWLKHFTPYTHSVVRRIDETAL